MGRRGGAGSGGAVAGTAPAERNGAFLSLGFRRHRTGHTTYPRPLFDRRLAGRLRFITSEGTARAWARGGAVDGLSPSMGLTGWGSRWGRGVGVPGAPGPQY